MGIIVFARMSSSRLPGKMLRPLGPTTLFDRVISRARLLEHELLLATSDQASDDPLVEKARLLDLPVFRGSLDDVLSRAVSAAEQAGFDAFCRLCGDRPFMPLEDMRRGMRIMQESFLADRPWDLITTHLPDPVPTGLTTEIIRTVALKTIHANAETSSQREHVTPAFYAATSRYRIHAMGTRMRQFAGTHFAVDTENDLDLLGSAIERHPDPGILVSKAAELINESPSYPIRSCPN